jgi:hypothetical protein
VRRLRERWRHGNPWWLEILLVLAFYQGYGRLRGLVEGDPVAALRNAYQVIHAEELLHIFHEAAIQRWFLPHETVVQFWDVYYGVIHFAVPVITFIVLWRRNRDRYRLWRNTFGIMLLLALIGFAAYPLTPPRLLPAPYHFVDTAQVFGGMGPFTESNSAAANLYAAMPSLHIGWSTWCAAALWGVFRRPWQRGLAVLYPFVTLTAVVVTGNHYILDGAGGVATLVLAWSIAVGLRAATRALRGRSGNAGPEAGPPPWSRTPAPATGGAHFLAAGDGRQPGSGDPR